MLLNSNIFELLCFNVPTHIALVFFLFNFKPETVPNHSIVWRCDLRESVSLVIIVVSSANSEIFTSWLFGKYMPSQFLFWRILRANNSTARIKNRQSMTTCA